MLKRSFGQFLRFIAPLLPKDQRFLNSLAYDNGKYRDIKHHILIFPEQRLVYVETPKAACTKIKKTLFSAFDLKLPEHAGLEEFHHHCKIHAPGYQLSPNAFYQALTSPVFFRFAFVRSPYARLYSAYKDKIATVHLQPDSGFYGEYKKIVEFHNARLGAEVTFAEFVLWVAQLPLCEMNHHWMPQVNVLWFDKIPYDFIGKVEDFEEDFKSLFKRLKLPESKLEHIRKRENATVSESAWEKAYSPELITLVNHAYRDDFRVFNYPILHAET